MRNISLIILIIFYTFFSYSCIRKKKDVLEEKKAVIMPVSILSDTTVYELKIEPDTFSFLTNVISAILINHSDEDAYYGSGDISREYYNDSIGRWEKAKYPSKLVPTHMLWIIPARSKNNNKISIYDNRPGKYRISFFISKPRCLKMECEYVLSTTSGLIVPNENQEIVGKK